METSSNSSSKKIPKLKSLHGTVSPINTSTLIRYLCSGSPVVVNANDTNGFSSPPLISAKSSSGSNSFGRTSSSLVSPLSSIENVMSPQLYRTTTPPRTMMKVVDDDVLVMDGILVGSNSVSNKGSRVSSSFTPTSRYMSSSSDSNSGGATSFKLELCRSWENFGHCRFGSKCQFAHGKEELRPNMKNKLPQMHSSSKSPSGKSYASVLAPHYFPPPPDLKEAANVASAQTGITINDSDYPSLTGASSQPAPSSEPATMISNTELSEKSPSPTPANPLDQDSKKIITSPTVTVQEPPKKTSQEVEINHPQWSPLDDGIEVALPGGETTTDDTKSQSFKKDVDAHIDNVLYGPSTRKRLSAFSEFCP